MAIAFACFLVRAEALAGSAAPIRTTNAAARKILFMRPPAHRCLTIIHRRAEMKGPLCCRSARRRPVGAGRNGLVIDLRSDTATQPMAEMRAAMAAAEVGDEQLREDPTVNELQRRAAELLGQEEALFLPTATMANQIALFCLSERGGELLAEERTHVLVFEAGGPAVHAGLVMRGLPGDRGRITPGQLRETVRRADDLQPASLVVLEQTHRSAGGRVWPLD